MISKTTKHFVLVFETNLRIAEITSVIIYEAIRTRITSVQKGIDRFFKALPIYRETEDLLLDLGKLNKLVPTPYHLAKH